MKSESKTHIYCISFKYAELQKQLQLDLAFLEKLLHLRLGLIQLLQDCLYVVDRAVMGGLVTRNGRIPTQSRERGGGRKKSIIEKKNPYNLDTYYIYMSTRYKPASDEVVANHIA